MKQKLFFIMFVVILSATGFSQSTISSLSEEDHDPTVYKYYNFDTGVRYRVTNNKEFVHLSLNISDHNSIMKIMRTGLKIYIDPKAKKKKNVYLQYPAPQPKGGFKPDQEMQGEKKKGKPSPPNLSKLLESLPSKAMYYVGTDSQEIAVGTDDNSGIKIQLEAISDTEMVYELFMPFDMLTEKSIEKLSFGIVSGAFEMPQNHQGMPPGGNGGGGGMPPGGNGGGGMPPGGGGHSGGTPPGGGQNSQKNEAIDFWFKVELVK